MFIDVLNLLKWRKLLNYWNKIKTCRIISNPNIRIRKFIDMLDCEQGWNLTMNKKFSYMY